MPRRDVIGPTQFPEEPFFTTGQNAKPPETDHRSRLPRISSAIATAPVMNAVANGPTREHLAFYGWSDHAGGQPKNDWWQWAEKIGVREEIRAFPNF